MSRDDAVAIQYGMLGGTVDEMISQVIDTTIECQSCRESFTVQSENLYGVPINNSETDDVIRWPQDETGDEWKLFVVCDAHSHALRVDEWTDEFPTVTKKYP